MRDPAIRHYRLIEARKAHGYSQAELARIAGVTTVTICHYEGLRQTPKPRVAKRIARALSCSVNELFFNDAREYARELTYEPPPLTYVRLEDLAEDDHPISTQCSPHESAVDAERRETVLSALGTLTRQQRTSIILYYGLDGRPEWTFRQIGRRLGLGPQRAGQIHLGALSRLRHPSRLRLLEKLVSDDDGTPTTPILPWGLRA